VLSNCGASTTVRPRGCPPAESSLIGCLLLRPGFGIVSRAGVRGGGSVAAEARAGMKGGGLFPEPE
jgi:hypothetical protein